MNITSISGTMEGPKLPVNPLKKDDYVSNLQKQISNIQEQVHKLSEDQELSVEQKMNKKKELEEQLKNLNSQLHQYQLQKKRQENEKSKEAAQEPEKDPKGSNAGLDVKEVGVILSIATSKEQIMSMKKIKTGLEGKLKTARNQEESISLQEKVDTITNRMYEKIGSTNKVIAESEEEKDEKTKEENKDQLLTDEEST